MRFLLFILTISFSIGLTAQELDCSNFKKGKYFYTPPNGGEVTFKRTKKKQIERYNNENQRFTFTITWTDECSYTLQLIKTSGVEKAIKKEIIGSKLYCTVKQSNLDHFEVEITSDADKVIQHVTIYRQ